MSGKKRKQKKKTIESKNQKIKMQFNRPAWFIKNMVGLFLSVLFILILYYNFSGYKWLWDSLVIRNLEIISQYPNMSIENKWEAKCKFDYTYVNFIKKNTPEDAIILMPSYNEILPKGEKSDFLKTAGGIKNKAWATYFLYPRKLVYEDEGDSNPYYDKANYVAIVNFKGYDRLNYPVEHKVKHHILPRNFNQGDKK